VVRDGAGRRALATQDGRDSARRRLRLTRAPRGAGAGAAARRGRAFAGAFRDLRAAGSVQGDGFGAAVRHRFTARAIETRWLLRRTRATGPHTAEVGFPSWGAGASVTAIARDGTRRQMQAHPIRLARVRAFEVRSAAAAYRIDRLRAPAGATARIARPAPQASNPQPGPSLAIRIVDSARPSAAALAARIVLAG
jgi:hypothetical protein